MGGKRSNSKKWRSVAPFGVATKRFATKGFHPGLDPTGSLQKSGGLGPGQYDVQFQDCCYKKRFFKESWTRKTEMEEFSKMLGYRNAEILRIRKDAQKANGPGTIEISETLFHPKSHNVKENIFFGKEKRFKVAIKQNVPPPGSYGKNHDPYLRREEASIPRHQWTPLPTFEWDGFIDRFKIGRFEHKGSLPPNIYTDFYQVGIEQTVSKQVSKRGPYDCSTGPRDSSTIKGYFAPRKFPGPKNWPIMLPTEMEKLKHKMYRHYGEFLKAERFTKNSGTRLMLTDLTMCPKNPNDPGPGHYTIKVKPIKKNLYAFNKSVFYSRPIMKWAIHPGVGRYNAVPVKCKHKEKRESWFFKSKTERQFYFIETYNNF